MFLILIFDLPAVIGIITALVAIGGLTLGYLNRRYLVRRDRDQDYDKLKEDLSDFEGELRVVQKQVALFWSIVEKGIGNMLHSPHRAELDRLIEKNQRREKLEPKEVKRFAELLQELSDDKELTPGEQTAAVILKAAVLARHSHDH